MKIGIMLRPYEQQEGGVKVYTKKFLPLLPEALLAVLKKYNLPNRFILWCGQIESRKNVARLLRAFALLKDCILHQRVLAGERWSTSAELQVTRELKIEDRLCLPGWIQHSDLPAVYRVTELFAVPSLYEGIGISLIEAMARGCPIVTTNSCAPPEVLDGSGVMVDPLSVEDITSGMRKGLFDAPLRAAICSKGHERAKAFSWDHCARQVLAVFDSLESPGTANASVAGN